MRAPKFKVLTFDDADLFESDLFCFLTEFMDASELIAACIVYFYHNESYFVDVLTESMTTEHLVSLGHDEDDCEELSKTINEVLSIWMDSFFEKFEPIFKRTREIKAYVFAKAVYSRKDKTVLLVFKRKKPNDPFYPHL